MAKTPKLLVPAIILFVFLIFNITKEVAAKTPRCKSVEDCPIPYVAPHVLIRHCIKGLCRYAIEIEYNDPPNIHFP
jgi:hypothetical protein